MKSWSLNQFYFWRQHDFHSVAFSVGRKLSTCLIYYCSIDKMVDELNVLTLRTIKNASAVRHDYSRLLNYDVYVGHALRSITLSASILHSSMQWTREFYIHSRVRSEQLTHAKLGQACMHACEEVIGYSNNIIRNMHAGRCAEIESKQIALN